MSLEVNFKKQCNCYHVSLIKCMTASCWSWSFSLSLSLSCPVSTKHPQLPRRYRKRWEITWKWWVPGKIFIEYIPASTYMITRKFSKHHRKFTSTKNTKWAPNPRNTERYNRLPRRKLRSQVGCGVVGRQCLLMAGGLEQKADVSCPAAL